MQNAELGSGRDWVNQDSSRDATWCVLRIAEFRIIGKSQLSEELNLCSRVVECSDNPRILTSTLPSLEPVQGSHMNGCWSGATLDGVGGTCKGGHGP